MAKEITLVDSGVSENFLDFEVWKELGIRKVNLEKVIPIYNMDRMTNKAGTIKSYCWLKVRLGNQIKNMKFYITDIGKEQFILGYLFLRVFNPKIDWAEGKVKDGSVEIYTLSFLFFFFSNWFIVSTKNT